MSSSLFDADLNAARLLASIPGFEQWHHKPLPSAISSVLQNSDEQLLMSLLAEALHLHLRRRPNPAKP